MSWQPRIVDDDYVDEEIDPDALNSLGERDVPPHARPKGRCGICSKEWDDHVTYNTKVPLPTRHSFERRNR